eukprot:5007048-Amphidinium_carterae.1
MTAKSSPRAFKGRAHAVGLELGTKRGCEEECGGQQAVHAQQPGGGWQVPACVCPGQLAVAFPTWGIRRVCALGCQLHRRADNGHCDSNRVAAPCCSL